MENVSTEIFNKYKDKILSSGALVPGTDQHEKQLNIIKGLYQRRNGETFGRTDTKSPEWLNLYG